MNMSESEKYVDFPVIYNYIYFPGLPRKTKDVLALLIDERVDGTLELLEWLRQSEEVPFKDPRGIALLQASQFIDEENSTGTCYALAVPSTFWTVSSRRIIIIEVKGETWHVFYDRDKEEIHFCCGEGVEEVWNRYEPAAFEFSPKGKLVFLSPRTTLTLWIVAGFLARL